MNGPMPLYHATMAMPVDGMPNGWTARVLHLRKPDGTTEPYKRLIDYMKAHPRRSRTWQDTAARALGLFWDFCQTRGTTIIRGMLVLKTQEQLSTASQRELFRAFALALISGTVKDGQDDSGLFWPRTPLARANGLVRSIEDFARWCDEDGGRSDLSLTTGPLLPQNGLGITELLVWGRMRNLLMLKHISSPTLVSRENVVDLGGDPRGSTAEPVKFFPLDHIDRLLWEGHKRPGREHDPNPFTKFNVRDQMITLLDGWGGLRRSEGLHLWVQDVVEEPGKLGHALVVLNHPSEARVLFTDPITGREVETTREEVLNRRYQLRPRHLVQRTRYHAGWKGMDLNRRHQAFVYWLDDAAGALFWVLYLGYIRYVRKPVMEQRLRQGGRDHPFLFVSEGEAHREGDQALIGDPYSAKAYERNHEAAVRRIGLEHRKDLGTTTHGLRHSYGQTLMNLGVPAAVIKKGLHHRHALSQVPYTVPTRETVNAELNAAWARSRGESVLVPPLGHESARALRNLHDFITSGALND